MGSPTMRLGMIGGVKPGGGYWQSPGDPVAYTRAIDAALKGLPEGTPVAHGKEFYEVE